MQPKMCGSSQCCVFTHELHKPYPDRRTSEEALTKRNAWIRSFWEELSILDGLQQSTPTAANYGSYQIALMPLDPTNSCESELTRFVVSSQLNTVECRRYAFSVENCSPNVAALDIIRSTLRDAEADVQLRGRTYPVRARFVVDEAERTTLARTSGGEVITVEYDGTSEITRMWPL